MRAKGSTRRRSRQTYPLSGWLASFRKKKRAIACCRKLRSAVVFTVQDVLADPPFSRIDLISCRNLLIYLRPEAQEKVISLFHFALREGGNAPPRQFGNDWSFRQPV
ncbi:MAG: CheR family methyltransferase [Methylovirgula sp.]